MTRRRPASSGKRRLPLNPANVERRLLRCRQELDQLLLEIQAALDAPLVRKPDFVKSEDV